MAVILALVLSLSGAVLGLAGAWLKRGAWMRAAVSTTFGQLAFVALGFVALAYAFVTDDFSVAYVTHNANSLLPWYYKLSALWGAHEGSLLLWTLIMCLWMGAVAMRRAHLPQEFLARALGVMALLNAGFLSFLLFTSNPFERLLPLAPPDGSDLNPLLQDFGLIVHPPMLYTGYVGFSVVFAFAIAGLLSGRLDSAWARWSRPWTNVAWAFLSVGIALGSWWAYYELGWGGWWFWDPVENASFMPWLAGTALVHSLAITEKRGLLRSWTLLLAITAFSLSLLGAFIVRSGVLTSVHAFAVDPTRGLFILAFLAVVVGGALTLYGLRAGTATGTARYGLFSREAFVLVNNLLLVVALAVVLLGTLYPLAYEAATGGDKISIGPPWFNRFFVPLMLLAAVALGVGPFLAWKRSNLARLRRRLAGCLAASVLAAALVALLIGGALSWAGAAAVLLGLWVCVNHGVDFWRRARLGRASLPLAYWGMSLAHVGFALSLLGVALTHELSVEKDIRISPGETVEHGGVRFRFDGVREAAGPNYRAQRGLFDIADGRRRFQLTPEKRQYLVSGSVMTEAAIDAGFFKDIYLSLGEPLRDGAWAVRVYVKPFVRWIWFGALLMACGAVLAVADKRYRRLHAARRQTIAPTPARVSA